MVQSNPSVRNFQEKDFRVLKGLYQRASVHKPHFTRSEDFLKYLMQYPGVNEDSIFVAEISNEITGLALVSITTEMGGLKQGSITELLTLDLSSLRLLIKAAVNFCSHKDVDMVVVVPPPLSGVNEVFKNWMQFETNVLMTRILHLPSLLQALLSSEKIISSCSGRRIVFEVGHESVEVKIGSRAIEVSDVSFDKRRTEMLISTTPQVFIRIVFGQLNPYVAYLTRRVRIRELKNTRIILRLLCLMQQKEPLYTSLADRI